MRFLLTALLFCTLEASALAQDAGKLPALVVTSSGYYYILVDDEGVPTMVEVPHVVHLDDGNPPDPDTPDTPDAPEDPFVTQVSNWAEEVNHPEGAQALSMVYGTVADNVADGTISADDAFPAIKQATDQVLDSIGNGAQWDGFRDKLGDYITDQLQAGKLGTKNEMVSFLRDVAKGLKVSTGADTALDPAVITAIIELILRIISLFGGGAGDGGGPV